MDGCSNVCINPSLNENQESKISSEKLDGLSEDITYKGNNILEKAEESCVKQNAPDQEHETQLISEKSLLEKNLDIDKPLCKIKMHDEAITNLKKNDREVNKTYSSIEDQIAQIVGEVYCENNDSGKKRPKNTSNTNEDEGDSSLSKLESSSKTGELEENWVEHQLKPDIEESGSEKVYENPVDHEEIEDSEIEEISSQPVGNQNEMDDTGRSIVDSDEECFLVFQQNIENLDGPSGQHSKNSDIYNEQKLKNSDDDLQYETKHLLDLKAVKVLHECSICQYTTPHMGILKKHVANIHNSKTKWKCKHCFQSFSSKVLLLKHVRKEHSKRSRKCPYCLCDLLCNGKVMRKHIQNMHPSECSSKIQIVKNKSEFVGLTRNGSRGMYRCEKCSYSNRNLGVMLSHIKMHNIKYVLKCLYCHYMINQRKLYRIHLANAHKLAKKIFICSRCFFQSEDQEEYDDHIYEPHMSHVCAACDFKTYQIESYYAHIEIHKNSKHNSVAYKKCDYKSNSENNLKCPLPSQDTENSIKDEIAAESKYSQEVHGLNAAGDIMTQTDLGREKDSEYEGNNIEFENIEYLNTENRTEIKAVFKEHYTQSEQDGVILFNCLKCDCDSKFGSAFEIFEHLTNVHSEKDKQEFLEKGENTVEFIQVEGEPDPANRYVIEPIVSNLQAQTNKRLVLPFGCGHCDFTTPTLQTKIFHEQETHDEVAQKCTTCNFEACNASILADHPKNQEDPIPQVLVCPFCELEMDNQISLKHHVDVEHLDMAQEGLQDSTVNKDDTMNSESVDDILDGSSVEMAFTINKGDFGKIYQCDLCSFNALNLLPLESHLKNDHNAESLVCPRCFQKQSSNVREFWDHLDQHCPQCRFQSSDPKEVRLHVLTHVPRYNRRTFDKTTIKPKRVFISDGNTPEEINPHKIGERSASAIANSKIVSTLNCDELDHENNSDEEIRIIFEDSPEDGDLLDIDDFEMNESSVAMNNSVERGKGDAQFGSSFDLCSRVVASENQEREIRLIIDGSNVDSFESEASSVKTSNFESNKKLIGKPVRIIKVPEFQCFDCLNVYKTRYTLVDHRKRLHGLKKPHSCTYCMEIFESYSYLKSHYYRIHKVSFHYKGPIFKCPLCEYNSINLKQTQKHVMKIHQRNVAGFQKRGTVC